MEYYTLGNTGLKVSRLSLGTMTFGDDWGWGADEADARKLFDLYLEAGGNFIDTADLYTNGNSERMLGKFVKDSETRDRVVISTKFSYFDIPADLQQRLDDVSRPESRFPYTFFETSLQGMINGGATVGDKPSSYHQPVLIEGAGAGVTSN